MDPIASAVTALLGPTNTGKTHRAIERLLEHDSGMIGLPLRLLAREVYDKVSSRVGEDVVALITGEEKRVPRRPRYWVATVEAMPLDVEVDFLAVDEVQLCEHPTRGHVFTDRLLHARGRLETWFLGADTMEPLIRRLLPASRFVRHPRLSALSYRGRSSIAGLPRRSAIVAFSVPQVYQIADAVRRRKGGAAVVLGALSPRARNAQVALYESGEVDYLVATDAIGMGLNLDVEHVALASLRKFDGKEERAVEPGELGQVVGRAGRYVRDGTFGVLAPLPELSDGVVRALQCHRFPRVEKAVWRAHEVDVSSLASLLASLCARPRLACLRAVESPDDLAALERLSQVAEVVALARDRARVQLLWEVCRIPDYRKVLPQHHASVLAEIYVELCRSGACDDAWLGERVDRLDRTDGDIEELMARLAAVRTWTYVSSHRDWVRHSRLWQERTRSIEDRVSDALHDGLVRRFVDAASKGPSRTHRRHQRGTRAVDAPDEARSGPFAKLLQMNLKLKADVLGGPGARSWVDDVIAADFDAFELSAEGKISFRGRVIGRLSRGRELLRPDVTVPESELFSAGECLRVGRRLRAWSLDLVRRVLGPFTEDDPGALSPAGRGLRYQLEQGLGTVLVRAAREQVRALSLEDRARFEASQVVLGELAVFSSPSLSEFAVTGRHALCSAFFATPLAARAPPGASCFPPWPSVPGGIHERLGYPVLGGLAIRADRIERIATEVRAAASRGPFAAPSELSSLVSDERKSIVAILSDLGYRETEEGRFARRRHRRRRRHR